MDQVLTSWIQIAGNFNRRPVKG